METKIQIDHREWKQWRDEGEQGAIGKLNALLNPHGVKVEVTSEPADWIELRASKSFYHLGHLVPGDDSISKFQELWNEYATTLNDNPEYWDGLHQSERGQATGVFENFLDWLKAAAEQKFTLAQLLDLYRESSDDKEGKLFQSFVTWVVEGRNSSAEEAIYSIPQLEGILADFQDSESERAAFARFIQFLKKVPLSKEPAMKSRNFSTETVSDLIAAAKKAHSAIYLHRNCPGEPGEASLKAAMEELERTILATQPGEWMF